MSEEEYELYFDKDLKRDDFLKKQLRDVVATKNGQYVAVDTCWTIDHGWETMVFQCNSEGNIESYADLDADWYDSEAEAAEGHVAMIKKWKEVAA